MVLPGPGYIIAAALLWATLGPVARFLLQAGVDPLEIGFWRAAMAGALFATHAVIRRQGRIAAADLPALAAFALVGVSVFYVAFFRAVETGGAALAAILLYTAPVWVAIAAALLLGERLTPRKLLAIAMSLAGVALVATGSGESGGLAAPPAALLWGLLAGIAYASYYVFGKRYFPRYAPALVFAVAMPVGALALLPIADLTAKPAWAWLLLAYIGVVPTYGAFLLYAAGLARVEATRAATIATLEPFAAALLAFAVWDETLRPLAYAGAALVIGGVAISVGRSAAGRAPHRQTMRDEA